MVGGGTYSTMGPQHFVEYYNKNGPKQPNYDNAVQNSN
jgi:hypothetical protein